MSRTKHRSGRTLGHEITLVLALKFAALALLWFVFFRAPMSADPQQLFEAHPPHASESTP